MSNLVIEVLNSTVTTHPTAKGSYQICELAFKNKTFQDKVEGKKIMSFAEKLAFETFKDATAGQVFTIGREKDDKGYWKWNMVTQGETAIMAQPQVTNNVTVSKPSTTPRSTYETPEERAARQVMIVKQSSISNAIALAATNTKAKVSPEEILQVASQFVAYVLGTDSPTAQEEVSAMKALIDLTDDIPV